MSLQDILQLSEQHRYHKQTVSEQLLKKNLRPLRKLIAYFREYPDVFVDLIKGKDSTFKFLFYQRIFLRICMRHRYVFATFPRRISAG